LRSPTLLISIDPELRRPIYVQIMDEVRRGRVLGILRPGDPLPSIRQLAADIGINPNTVRQAYRELEREGVVHVRRGEGTYASELPPDDGERKRLLLEVAERALRDAHRYGVGPEELMEAIRQVSGSIETETPK
jgi:GntR family transcriptional regulator